jgi:hypothetical protein
MKSRVFGLYSCKTIGRMLALGYGSKRRSRKEKENVNFVKDTVTVTGSK